MSREGEAQLRAAYLDEIRAFAIPQRIVIGRTPMPTTPVREDVTITDAVEIREISRRASGIRKVVVTIDDRSTVTRIKRRPSWQPGDVIVITYPASTIWVDDPAGERRYTHVRGAHSWPGERHSSLSDADVNRKFDAGQVEHVRDGKPVVGDGLAQWERDLYESAARA